MKMIKNTVSKTTGSDGAHKALQLRHSMAKQNNLISLRNMKRLVTRENRLYLKWHKKQVIAGSDPDSLMTFEQWFDRAIANG